MTISHENSINQICLVKNPPPKSTDLKELIRRFNEDNTVQNKGYYRLFIKEHDYIIPIVPFFNNNVDYTLVTTNRYDLDNVDFLAESNDE